MDFISAKTDFGFKKILDFQNIEALLSWLESEAT